MPDLPAAGYDYVLAGNGLFLRAENWIVDIVENIAPARVAGLPDLEESRLVYKLEPIPGHIFDAIRREAEKEPERETFFRVKYVLGEYRIFQPAQTGSAASLSYEVTDQDNVVLEMHTHPKMNAFYSEEDDKDEKGFRIYGVLASPDEQFDDFAFRLGVYGYHFPLSSLEFSDTVLETIKEAPERP